MSDLFVPLIVPPESIAGPALWFAFQGTTVLVSRHESGVELPVGVHIRELGLEPVRVQYVGRYAGQHCFSCEIAADVAPPEGMSWAGLRSLFGAFEDPLFAVLGRAIQIMDWDRSHQFCGRCGTPTARKPSELARQCPGCGQTHYPRIAPAVMALVRRRDQLLLARSPHFPPGMHSALAGFVEPGESLEQCLAREIAEEVGVQISNSRYFASQSWPFPHSMMIAFVCDWSSGEIRPQDGEIEEANWFDVLQLPKLPSKISIARRLIDAISAEIRGEFAK
jgi:NAD+ diphosphatase